MLTQIIEKLRKPTIPDVLLVIGTVLAVFALVSWSHTMAIRAGFVAAPGFIILGYREGKTKREEPLLFLCKWIWLCLAIVSLAIYALP